MSGERLRCWHEDAVATWILASPLNVGLLFQCRTCGERGRLDRDQIAAIQYAGRPLPGDLGG